MRHNEFTMREPIEPQVVLQVMLPLSPGWLGGSEG
jgi:hypothetical protein